MPCRSPDFSHREKESALVRELLQYIYLSISTTLPSAYREITPPGNDLGNLDTLDRDTALLCDLCTNMAERQKQRVMYDGRKAMARKLANWWDEHQEADRQCREAEARATRNAALRAQAIRKLSQDELEALGINP